MINKAITFAAVAHEGQNRKGTGIPYVFHPFEVGYILAQITLDEEVICAGILHDTMEDAAVSYATIEKLFSRRTAELVRFQSEDKTLSWEDRKQHTIDYFKTCNSREEMLICCADKLSNIRSIERDYAVQGEDLWKKFKRGFEHQKWYYKNMVESLKGIEGEVIYKEFRDTVERVFK